MFFIYVGLCFIRRMFLTTMLWILFMILFMQPFWGCKKTQKDK